MLSCELQTHTPPKPVNEPDRLATLGRVGVLTRDVPAGVQRMLKRISFEFQCTDCFITVVGDRLQHIKAFTGFNLGLIDRDHSFCTHTILQDAVTVVQDTLKDERFRDNPYVLGRPHIRFYAGAPLATSTGEKLGAVCLLSSRPREFSAANAERLTWLTASVSRKLGLFDDSQDLSVFDADDLRRLMMDEADRGDPERLLRLIDAYYERLRARSERSSRGL